MMTDSPMPAGPPPGWYADSPHAARLRWWNGTAWTDHYQAATDGTSTVASVEVPVEVVQPIPEPLPTTRAARRAAATASVSERADPPPASAAPVVQVAPEPAAFPPSVAAPEPAAPSAPPQTRPPGGGMAASAHEAFPDQILGRAPRMGEYRPPPRPVVYQPHAVNYAAPAPPTFIPVTSKNGPATASLVLSVLGLVTGVLVHTWVSPTRPTLGGLINLLIIAAFLCAVGLAVVGLVLAAQRPTRKGRSVVALVISVLLLGGMFALLALRLIPVGALYGAG
jgi:hypothetical protein